MDKKQVQKELDIINKKVEKEERIEFESLQFA
jgi:hypothetical protein